VVNFAKTTLAASALAFIGTGTVLAADPAGIYLQIGGGGNWQESTQITGPGLIVSGGATSRSSINYDIGPFVTGSFGYAFGNGFRGEWEFGYRDSPASNVTLPSGATTSGNNIKADTTVYTYLFQGIYDFDLEKLLGGGPLARFSPHIGFGIGAANVNTNRSTSDTPFAYQVIAGVEYEITPNIKLGIDYRYLGTDTVNLKFTQIGSQNFNSTANYEDNAFLVTLRWRFGVLDF
jgi:OmpA-OmpF porin, OOP family